MRRLVLSVSVLFEEDLGCTPSFRSSLQSCSPPQSLQVLFKTFLFSLSPALRHMFTEELGSLHQFLVFVSVHLPPPDLQNVFTADGRQGALPLLQMFTNGQRR